MIENWKEIE